MKRIQDYTASRKDEFYIDYMFCRMLYRLGLLELQ